MDVVSEFCWGLVSKAYRVLHSNAVHINVYVVPTTPGSFAEISDAK